VAPHDYAKRKAKKKQLIPAVSRFVMVFTLLVSIAFVVGLLMLSQQPDDTKASQVVAEKTTAKTTSSKAAKKAPSAPENTDSFDFYTLLPDSQVTPSKVEAYLSTPKDPNKKTNTLLQAGSFRRLADADRLRARLILLNMPSVVAEKTTSDGGSVWYRVRIGPFSNRSTLNKAEDILAQQGIESIRINKTSN